MCHFTKKIMYVYFIWIVKKKKSYVSFYKKENVCLFYLNCLKIDILIWGPKIKQKELERQVVLFHFWMMWRNFSLERQNQGNQWGIFKNWKTGKRKTVLWNNLFLLCQVKCIYQNTKQFFGADNHVKDCVLIYY